MSKTPPKGYVTCRQCPYCTSDVDCKDGQLSTVCFNKKLRRRNGKPFVLTTTQNLAFIPIPRRCPLPDEDKL